MQQLIVNDFRVNIVYKKIKYIYLRVLKNGEVQITAPPKTSLNVINEFIITKTNWILKRSKAVTEKESTILYQYQSGETHYYFGKPYHLQILDSKIEPSQENSIVLDKGNLNIYLNPRNTLINAKYIMLKWIREQIKIKADDLLTRWQDNIGVVIESYKLKHMKSRWGSCNYRDHVITLNLELIKYPIECLEYVVVHELVHLLEPSHNYRFKALMSDYLPSWRETSNLLNTLAAESPGMGVYYQ